MEEIFSRRGPGRALLGPAALAVEGALLITVAELRVPREPVAD